MSFTCSYRKLAARDLASDLRTIADTGCEERRCTTQSPRTRAPKVFIAGAENAGTELLQEVHRRAIAGREFLEGDKRGAFTVARTTRRSRSSTRRTSLFRAPGVIARRLAPTETGRPQRMIVLRIRDGTRLLMILVSRPREPVSKQIEVDREGKVAVSHGSPFVVYDRVWNRA